MSRHDEAVEEGVEAYGNVHDYNTPPEIYVEAIVKAYLSTYGDGDELVERLYDWYSDGRLSEEREDLVKEALQAITTLKAQVAEYEVALEALRLSKTMPEARAEAAEAERDSLRVKYVSDLSRAIGLLYDLSHHDEYLTKRIAALSDNEPPAQTGGEG